MNQRSGIETNAMWMYFAGLIHPPLSLGSSYRDFFPVGEMRIIAPSPPRSVVQTAPSGAHAIAGPVISSHPSGSDTSCCTASPVL